MYLYNITPYPVFNKEYGTTIKMKIVASVTIRLGIFLYHLYKGRQTNQTTVITIDTEPKCSVRWYI